MEKILIIGGVGYIGTEVIKYFLNKKKKIFCNDNFIYGQKNSITKFIKNKNFKLLEFDYRDTNKFKKVLSICDSIIFLGGMVGDPITSKYKKISKNINYIGIKNFINLCKTNYDGRFIFVSTCSNYGLSKNMNLLSENATLNPLSIYAKNKVMIEKYILQLKNVKFIPTILRFSTAFGLSSERMRFDLTINQFVKEAFFKNKLEIYDGDTYRPYCHVKDFCRIIDKVLSSDKKLVNFEVFNAGDSKNNYNKTQIIKIISKYLNIENVKFISSSKDRRNYRVDFKKIRKNLLIQSKYSVDYGVKEIISYLKKKKNLKPMGNYRIQLKK